jgi:hypothetical protein
MKKTILMLTAAAALFAQTPARMYTGVITDTMCGADHSMMGVKPDSKCVRDCVKGGNGRWKYALLDGTKVYVLSDQQTPEKFAAQKVNITGVLDKNNVLTVQKIEAAQ